MMDKNSPVGNAVKKSLFAGRIMVKVAGIALLTLVLLIPLGMVRSTLGERQERRNEAVMDITSSWGKEQVIIGPVLSVPYRYTYKTFKDTAIKGEIKKMEVLETATARAWFLPDVVEIEGSLEPLKLHRGIYDAVVYKGQLKLSGRFGAPDFKALKIAEDRVYWDEAEVVIGVTDLRGTGEVLQFRSGQKSFRMSPGTPLEGLASGVRSHVGGLAKSSNGMPFSLDISLKGSGGISFAPVAIQNRVRLSSSWPDPSFKGQFLPTDRSVTPEGFKALWNVSYYGRAYPQSGASDFPADQVPGSLFGVSLFNAVDSYRNVERAIKYGVLFLTLVLAAFFLFETLAALKIHPIQYTLVGAAMCLFYLALLSISEFVAFGWTYLLSAGGTVLMIALYSRTVLHSGPRAILVGGELAMIYGYLYVALQLQDYSLLLGTLGVFAVLSAIMYLTRNVNWYALERE